MQIAATWLSVNRESRLSRLTEKLHRRDSKLADTLELGVKLSMI